MKTSLITAIMIVFEAICFFWYKARGAEKLQANSLNATSSFQHEIALFMDRSPPSIEMAQPTCQNGYKQ